MVQWHAADRECGSNHLGRGSRTSARGFVTRVRLRRSRVLKRRASHSRERTSCSQTRTTWNPALRSSLATSWSRSLFRSIFLDQNSRRFWGMLRLHFEHPCQKHPSTNSATASDRKRKSGLPNTFGGLRCHPLIRALAKQPATDNSVERFPLARTRDICIDRSADVRESARLTSPLFTTTLPMALHVSYGGRWRCLPPPAHVAQSFVARSLTCRAIWRKSCRFLHRRTMP